MRSSSLESARPHVVIDMALSHSLLCFAVAANSRAFSVSSALLRRDCMTASQIGPSHSFCLEDCGSNSWFVSCDHVLEASATCVSSARCSPAAERHTLTKRSVPTAEAMKAGSDSCSKRRMPRPPLFTGSEACNHFGWFRLTFTISSRVCFRLPSISGSVDECQHGVESNTWLNLANQSLFFLGETALDDVAGCVASLENVSTCRACSVVKCQCCFLLKLFLAGKLNCRFRTFNPSSNSWMSTTF